MPDVPNIVVRWLHISSAIALIGGIVYARLVTVPAMRGFSAEVQEQLGEALARRYRPLLFAAIGALLVSGTYNLMNKTGAGALYHALIGIKVLLALHVFAVGFLAVQPGNHKRARQMSGVILSGLVIVALSAVLRSISISLH